MTIRYDANTEKILFWNEASIDHTRNDPDKEMTTGEILAWADWNYSRQTSDLENFWSNALVLAPDASNHPRIVWGAYGDINGATLTYNIYKATNYSVTPPSLSSFNLMATVSGNTYEYIDEDFTIGGNFFFHYYVK